MTIAAGGAATAAAATFGATTVLAAAAAATAAAAAAAAAAATAGATAGAAAAFSVPATAARMPSAARPAMAVLLRAAAAAAAAAAPRAAGLLVLRVRTRACACLGSIGIAAVPAWPCHTPGTLARSFDRIDSAANAAAASLVHNERMAAWRRLGLRRGCCGGGRGRRACCSWRARRRSSSEEPLDIARRHAISLHFLADRAVRDPAFAHRIVPPQVHRWRSRAIGGRRACCSWRACCGSGRRRCCSSSNNNSSNSSISEEPLDIARRYAISLHFLADRAVRDAAFAHRVVSPQVHRWRSRAATPCRGRCGCSTATRTRLGFPPNCGKESAVHGGRRGWGRTPPRRVLCVPPF